MVAEHILDEARRVRSRRGLAVNLYRVGRCEEAGRAFLEAARAVGGTEARDLERQAVEEAAAPDVVAEEPAASEPEAAAPSADSMPEAEIPDFEATAFEESRFETGQLPEEAREAFVWFVTLI